MKLIPGGEPYFFRGGPVGALLVHGFTGAPREMRPVGEALAAAGHTVLGVRLTHHGTRPEDMFRSRWQDWYASVLDGYCLLRDQCAHVFVMGLSMGGALSLLLAAEQPVAGVVSLAAPSRPFLDGLDWRTRYARLFGYFIPYVDKGSADQDADPDHAHYPRYPVAAIGELRRLLEALDRRVPGVRAPALIIHGRRDRGIPLANGEYLHRQVAGAERLWLDESGHIVTEGPEREQVFAAVLDFVQRVATAAPIAHPLAAGPE
jgi:carboxylesterase